VEIAETGAIAQSLVLQKDGMTVGRVEVAQGHAFLLRKLLDCFAYVRKRKERSYVAPAANKGNCGGTERALLSEVGNPVRLELGLIAEVQAWASGCGLVDQANEMFRVLPIALARDRIVSAGAFRQAFVVFVILSPLAEAVG